VVVAEVSPDEDRDAVDHAAHLYAGVVLVLVGAGGDVR
jgi:hypothetical protein